MSTVDAGRLDAVANRLGEAVLDPGQWPRLMEDICWASGTHGAVLLQSDIRTPDVPTTASVTDYLAAYFNHGFHLDDVRARRGVPLLLGGRSVISDQDLFNDPAQMRRDPLYAHAAGWGLGWWAGVGFYAGSALWALALQRTSKEGPFEQSDLRALASLPAQLTEAATLSKAVGRQILLGVTDALQLVQQPTVALDHFGCVIGMNREAEAMLDEDLTVRDRRLVVRDNKARVAIDKLALQFAKTSDKEALRVAPIVVRREGKPPILIRTVAISGTARNPFLGARALLIFQDLSRPARPEANVLRQAFDLTTAEALLATMLAAGQSLDDAAGQLGIGRETARTQLKAIFAKTDTHRQSALVALLSRL